MEKSKNRVTLIGCCLIGLLLAAGCNSSTVLNYEGDTQPLGDVAVLVTSSDTCPVLKINDEFVNFKNRPGTEYHLLPGTYSLEVIYQTPGTFTGLRIDQLALDYDFQAGHVYAVKKSFIEEDAQELTNSPWTPNIQDLGDVVTYAEQNPNYCKSSKHWKTLRKENGLTPPSFFDFKWLAKDPSPEEVQQF